MYYEKLRQHRDSRHHPEPPLWPSVDLDLIEGTRLLPVVEQERAAHRMAVTAQHRAPAKRIPVELLFILAVLVGGVVMLIVQILRAVL